MIDKFIGLSLLATLMACTNQSDQNSAVTTEELGSICPEANEGFTGGCLLVNENTSSQASEADKIQLFYQWYGERDNSKRTIVFLNGGPGGSMNGYLGLEALTSLSSEFNILFYDQRGIGRSSSITPEVSGEIDMSHYHTKDNVEDLAQIIDRAIGEKVVLLGHSYGGHLGFAFGAKYPNKVEKFIALNGAMDSLGFVLQSYKKSLSINSIISQIDEAEMAAFMQLLQGGELISRSGTPVSLQEFSMFLTGQVSYFSGIEGAVQEINESIERNREAIDRVINARNQPESVQNIRFDAVPDESFNFYVNPFIVCHAFINASTTEGHEPAVAQAAQAYIDQSCAGIYDESELMVFDMKDKAEEMSFPTLIIGSTHDPLVALEAQKRDYELLAASHENVRLVVMENTGHQTMEESPRCFEKAVRDFLTSDVTRGTTTCIEQAFR